VHFQTNRVIAATRARPRLFGAGWLVLGVGHQPRASASRSTTVELHRRSRPRQWRARKSICGNCCSNSIWPADDLPEESEFAAWGPLVATVWRRGPRADGHKDTRRTFALSAASGGDA